VKALGATVLLVAGASLLATEPLTLARALRQAKATSLRAELAGLDRLEAVEDVRQTKAFYYPDLQLLGGYRVLDERPALLSQPMHLGPFTVPSQAFPIEDTTSWRFKVSAQYLLWDFGKRASAVAAQDLKAQAVASQGTAEVQKAQREAAARYLALLDLQAQKRVVAQRRSALEAHRNMVKALFEQGVVARNDLLRTEVALRKVDDAERALERARLSALEALNVAMGLPGTTPQELPEELVDPPALPWDEATCRTKANTANDIVKAAEAKLRALERQARFRRLDHLPNVVMEASHSYAQNPYLLHNHENALFVGLSWKIFDGGVRSSKVRQADAEILRAQRELQEARRGAEAAASAALRAWEQALQEVATARVNVEAALENLRIVSDQYREGLVRNADVLDAEAVLAESRSALAERRYRAYVHQVELLTLLGEDVPAFYERLENLTKPAES